MTILNLMEKKIGHLLYKEKDDTFHYDSTSKDYKNTSVNFNINQENKISCNLKKKYSSNTLNKYKPVKSKEIKYNSNTNDNKLNKLYLPKKSKSKNKISVNLTERNNDNMNINNNTLSSYKNNREKKSRIIIKKKLSLSNKGRLYTDMNLNLNVNKRELKKNLTVNFNNEFQKTEIDDYNDYNLNSNNKNINEMIISLKKNKNKNKLKLADLDLEKLIIEKGTYIKGNFQNNYLKGKEEINKRFYSPKLSIKFKFKENTLNNNKNTINCKNEQERYSIIRKDRNNTKILTPKGNQIKLNSFSNNLTIDKEMNNNYLKEKDELRKKYLNLIDFYSLLSKKLKKTCINNIDIKKKYQSIKEKCKFLQKQKNKLVQIFISQESKKIKNKTIVHFEEEQLCNKIIDNKIKEKTIYENIFGSDFDGMEMQNKIKLLISERKDFMLNLIKNIVKYYGNISQIYNDDINKKNILKSLLNKYDIKEKIKIDLNYISYIHKENNFEDKIITEVDEDIENEEEDEDKEDKDDEINQQINNNNNQPIFYKSNVNINQQKNKIKNDNSNKDQLDINKDIIEINEIKSNNNIENNNYDENINILIKKILIEQFPENYNTNDKFIYLDNNKYSFKGKIFLVSFEENNVVLKEEEEDINDRNNKNKLTLDEFYHKYCIEKKENKSNFVYTKKIRPKYVKMKSGEKENSPEKKPKNENSTTMSDNNEKIQQSIASKLNELNECGESKNSMSYEKEGSSL